MLPKITIGVLVCVVAATVQAFDYCNLKSCQNVHIRCNNNWRYGPNCSDDAELIDLSPYIRDIVDFHNEHRNIIAGGDLEGYLPAVLMDTMQWDNELAMLATYCAKKCTLYQYDQCLNTEEFHQVGYIIYRVQFSQPYIVRDAIFAMLRAWWNEHKGHNMDLINNYKGTSAKLFATMVKNENLRIGCAASRWTEGEWRMMLTVCLYARMTKYDEKLYISGEPASQCKTGRNPKYPNLCSVKEKYSGQ